MGEAKKLPAVKYKGSIYTKDDRLQEYRSYIPDVIVLHIPFQSDEGRRITWEGKEVPENSL